MTPTQLSKAWCSVRGWPVDDSERRIAGKISKDLFGMLDLVALSPEAIIGIQTTTAAHLAARRRKVAEARYASAWLLAGGRLLVHGWRKRQRLWVVNCWEVLLDSQGLTMTQMLESSPCLET